MVRQGQGEKAHSCWIVGFRTLIWGLICIPLRYFIDIASSAIALFHSHHCIYGIHFYEIWLELDNTIWPFGLCLTFCCVEKLVLSCHARKAVLGI